MRVITSSGRAPSRPARTRLPARDLPVALEAVACSVLVGLGLRCVGARRVIAILNRVPPMAGPPPAGRIERIARIAEAVSRRVAADPTCLKAGLVAYAVLRRRRVDVALVVGVRRPEADSFEAHAWVEHRGGVLCGAARREAFHELWRVPGGSVPDDAA